MRTCPNRNCRLVHGDAVNQCPECGANMARRPDEPLDPNMALFAQRSRALSEAAQAQRRNFGTPSDLVDVALEVIDDPERMHVLSAADAAYLAGSG